MITVAIGADHAGFALKEDLKAWLRERGHAILDCGTHSLEAVDYPDIAGLVAEAVTAGSAERGVLVCGTGIGMAMAANKIPGIRAAVCGDDYTARMSREHNDANVLALGARLLEPGSAVAVLGVWLDTVFAGGRHARRVEKLSALEQVHAPAR
jgi:ribose 5-phosphate isomerase B